MKSLLAIFTYCPDTDRVLILLNLLEKIQSLRGEYDIIVVSHSELPSTVKDLSDYIFIESNNHLLHDFENTNKFWFKTDSLFLHSSLIYPFSTHKSIYSLVHFVLNFSKYKNYKKVHFLEYDINLENLNIIDDVEKRLNDYDNVMFRSDDGWVHGIYFATNIRNLPDHYYRYDSEFIISEIQSVETRMTEHYTPKFFGINNRTTYFESTNQISSNGILQKKDSHSNQDLNWCIPVVQKNINFLYFFIFNEKGGNYKATIITNLGVQSIDAGKKEFWKLVPLGPFSEITDLKIIINDQIKHNLIFDEKNRSSFIENNYFYYK